MSHRRELHARITGLREISDILGAMKGLALVELRRALTLQKDAEIAAHLAEVLWYSGRKDEARKYFEQARKIDPDNRSLKRALEKTGA